MICKRCKKDKSPDRFYNWDRYKCRDCRKEIDKERYSQRKEYFRNYWKKWYKIPKNQKKHAIRGAQYGALWNKKHRKEHKVEAKLNYLVRQGKIEKPSRCIICLTTQTKIEAHHFSYNSATDVLWVCRRCHKAIHFLIKNSSRN